jgi:hypothetical protein
MYGILLVCIVILLFILQRREHFDLFGYPIFSMGSCAQMDERDAGLCYDKCTHGYGGVGPVCWKETIDTGTGSPVELEPCPKGWNNWGLVCQKPLKFYWFGVSGGNIWGRLNNGGICPKTKVKIAGLCYAKCPKEWPYRLPWPIAQRCAKVGGALSYGRGVGRIPAILRIFDKKII